MWIETKILGNCSQEVIGKRTLINLDSGISFIDSEAGSMITNGDKAILISYPYERLRSLIEKKDLNVEA